MKSQREVMAISSSSSSSNSNKSSSSSLKRVHLLHRRHTFLLTITRQCTPASTANSRLNEAASSASSCCCCGVRVPRRVKQQRIFGADLLQLQPLLPQHLGLGPACFFSCRLRFSGGGSSSGSAGDLCCMSLLLHLQENVKNGGKGGRAGKARRKISQPATQLQAGLPPLSFAASPARALASQGPKDGATAALAQLARHCAWQRERRRRVCERWLQGPG